MSESFVLINSTKMNLYIQVLKLNEKGEMTNVNKKRL